MTKAATTTDVSVSSLRFPPRRIFVRVGPCESRSLMQAGTPSGERFCKRLLASKLPRSCRVPCHLESEPLGRNGISPEFAADDQAQARRSADRSPGRTRDVAGLLPPQ